MTVGRPARLFGVDVTQAEFRQLTARATCCQLGEVEEGEHHCASAVAFMVAGGGFEPPTFGL